MHYPSRDEELEVLRRTTGAHRCETGEIADAQSKFYRYRRSCGGCRSVTTSYNFALDIVQMTRPNEPGASDFVRHWLSWGAGPRAGQFLILAGKARALCAGVCM